MPTTAAEFESMRAYTDADLPVVLAELLRDRQLLDLLARYRLAMMHSFAPQLARFILWLVLKYKLRRVTTIFGFQERITGDYVFHMLESSVERFEISGLDNLAESGGGLLLSNHRDIVLDPIFVDYALFTKRRATARLATGDNLTAIPFAIHLMRLNKSFWVRRGETSLSKMLANIKTLSKYIRMSIVEDGELVWLAQREGRAKNGRDYTGTAVLKMLKLARRELNWQQTFEQLKVLPISISYEYDPCDLYKATELVEKHRTGIQHKDDTRSVVTSITAAKGRVAIHFSEKVKVSADATTNQIAECIDKSIITNYRIFPSNLTALALLAEEQVEPSVLTILETSIEELRAVHSWYVAKGEMPPHDSAMIAKLEQISDKQIRQTLLGSYANPCISAWRLAQKPAS